ncbi:hypothetical protein E1200_20130 [Actinomadura sp. GC306]|uniref:hypothetical protein n=1 Tax=Actinomadura sp. GC306 TaxID=2530367 RepID=UPI001044BB33|nr:hypothetical protein [Actinomadura sp. GC306]TDC64520.1 hypothetical protein E1200_20130 [Actinomadura sp. GC306]
MTRSPRRLKQQVQDTVGEQIRDLPLHAVRLAMFGVGRALLLGDRVTRDYKEITKGDGVKPVLGRLRDDVHTTAEKVVGTVVERVRGEESEPEPEPARRPRTAAATSRNADEEITIGKPGARTRPAPRHTRPGPPPKPPKRTAAGKHRAGQGAGTEADKAGPFAEPAPKPVPSEPKPEPAPQAEPAPSPKAADTPGSPAEGKDAPKAAGKAEDDKPEDKAAKDEAAFEPKPELKPAAQAEAEHLVEDLPVPDYDSATLPQLRARLRGLSVEQVKLLREYERKHAGREDVIRMYERRIAKLNGTT